MGAGSQLRSSEPALTICSFIFYFLSVGLARLSWHRRRRLGAPAHPWGCDEVAQHLHVPHASPHHPGAVFWGAGSGERGSPWLEMLRRPRVCPPGGRARVCSTPGSWRRFGEISPSCIPPPSVMTKADSKASARLELSLAESCEILEFSAWKASLSPGSSSPPPPSHLKSALGLIRWSLW